MLAIDRGRRASGRDDGDDGTAFTSRRTEANSRLDAAERMPVTDEAVLSIDGWSAAIADDSMRGVVVNDQCRITDRVVAVVVDQ